MSFGNPWALLLLLLLPFFIYLGWGRLTHLSRLRRWVAIGLRMTLLILLILALADTQRLNRSDALSVIFLVDQSDSVGPAGRDEALTFIQDAVADQGPDDTAGVVVFGENALVEESPRPDLDLAALSSTPDSGYTNLADAIRLGSALFPADSARRLVLISDGQNNLGDARSAAQLAAAAGIELSTYALTAPDGPEVRLDRMQVPPTLSADEPFDMLLEIHSSAANRAEVQIFADGQLLTSQPVNLQAGSNRFIFPVVAGGEGFSTFQARLAPAEDTLPQNNRLDAYSIIEGPQQVLLVSRSAAETANLIPAIEAAGLQVASAGPAELPTTPTDLNRYASVVLVNLPAFTLSPRQLELLQVYVRDLGGGLVVVGGPESFGAGGYYETPLEETLPVDMLLKDTERLPGMSMFMVIDKSGSMETAGTVGGGGPRKVELAKEAIYRSVSLLTPLDRVAVVAFDNAARWVVRPTSVVDVAGIRSQVGTIRASGGTDILAGLEMAAEAIADEPSQVKHIVLLTDGGANPEGISELVDDLVAQAVSVSVVAIGDDYASFLEEVAERGNGRFHFARDASTIPQIFAQEAALAQRAYIIEERFTPALAGPSPIMRGISALPALHGYIGASRKATAQTILVSEQDDPILAQWQYGLGRAVAWTSDARGQWAREWVAWDAFARFWGQAVRWTIISGPQGGLDTRVTLDRESGTYRLSVEALDERGNFLNNLDLTGSLVSPELEQEGITLSQIGPGLYETDIRPDETGAYLLRVQGEDDEGNLVSAATQGFVVSYSPEYVGGYAPPTLMADLAELGQGQVYTADDGAAVFRHNLPPVRGAQPLWPLFLTIFVFLLPLDVGIRRIIIGRAEVRRAWHRLRAALPQPRSRRAPDQVSTSSVRSLLSVKNSGRETADEAAPAGREAAPSTPAPTAQRSARPDRPPLVINRQAGENKAGEPDAADLETNSDDDRMSRLLRAKRKARRRDESE